MGRPSQTFMLRGPIRLREALTIARQIAEALEAAHDKGIIHRDLKPANIKIAATARQGARFRPGKGMGRRTRRSRSGAPTLTATDLGERAILGTPAYMSPEQARGRASTSAPTSGRSVACSSKC